MTIDWDWNKVVSALLVVGIGWVWSIDDRVRDNKARVDKCLGRDAEHYSTAVEQRNKIRTEVDATRGLVHALDVRLSHGEAHFENAKMCSLEHLP